MPSFGSALKGKGKKFTASRRRSGQIKVVTVTETTAKSGTRADGSRKKKGQKYKTRAYKVTGVKGYFLKWGNAVKAARRVQAKKNGWW
jgi:hypothetical protein